jgi:hypothetical protein
MPAIINAIEFYVRFCCIATKGVKDFFLDIAKLAYIWELAAGRATVHTTNRQN